MTLPALKVIPPHEVLDVWGRQFLSESLTKSEPAAASMFVVNIQLETDSVEALLLQHSGVAGCYLQPRTQDGRKPHQSYQVVWLPRKTYQEASICQQANKAQCQLARSGSRYGIRVCNEDAEATHEAHRPDVVYLQGNSLMKFRMGPIPYGSSKQSITTLVRKWGWQARPLAPAGPTRTAMVGSKRSESRKLDLPDQQWEHLDQS